MNSSSVHMHFDMSSPTECVLMSLRDFMLKSMDGADNWEYAEKDESRMPVADMPLIRLENGELNVIELRDLSLKCLRSGEEK
jgi:hypothetical protein